MELKFEAGKLYQTRGKHVVKCVHVFFRGLTLWAHDETEHGWTTEGDGRYYRSGEQTCDWDIIGEYHEPRRWTVDVWEHKWDKRLMIAFDDDQMTESWERIARCEIAEGEGLDA